MRKVLPLVAVLIMANALTIAAIAQAVTIKGTVKDATTKGTVSAVSVVVKGSMVGTYTDGNGNFTLTTSQALPLTLEISAVNFATKSVTVSSASSNVDIELEQSAALGQEVVVSATRTPARIMESPVSIERVSNAAIRSAPATSYYDIISTLKGVDVITSSLTFKTPATRGFNGSGNVRVNQMMDNMDNQAPGLNFSVGGVMGLTELDVDNFELLQGASSALYGSGGMNGTILINGKNPFKYQGLSFQVKTGMMNFGNNERDPSPYFNWAVRWGQKISDRLAFKIGVELVQAKDWVAGDYRNYKRFGTTGQFIAGTRDTDPNYDGANVYGDETTTNLKAVLTQVGASVPFWADYIKQLPANMPVSRTGYAEKEVANPNTVNFRFNGSLNYKLGRNVEASLSGFWGTGNTTYTGSQRYAFREFKFGQYKLDLTGKNWFVRAYTTQENAGESHNLTVASQLFNEAWKPSTTWYPEYALAYMNAKLAGRPDLESHNIARATADIGRPAAGSAQFNKIFDAVRMKPIPQGGLLLDKSDLYQIDGQYNFSDVFKPVEILVGGNFKQYVLNSEGTLFADKPGEPIKISEFGMYAQLAKWLFNEKLRLTASGRYDKNENFEGRFTPRLTAMLKVAKDNNIRFSFQSAYRFPSNQQQFIDLDVGNGRLIGCNKILWDKYGLIENAPYNPSNLSERLTYTEVKPESVTSFELGYKALFSKKILFDVYGYFGNYENFISRRDAVQFSTGTPSPTAVQKGYSIVVNAPGKVQTYGWGASLDYLLPKNFTIGVNASSDVLNDVPDGFRAFFNAPKLRTNVSFGNSGFGKSKLVGFNVTWRWQEGFYYDSDFIAGDLPAYHTVDASINFKAPKIRSLIKIGATNLLNQYYQTATGNPAIGGLYYVSFAYNVL